MQELTDKQLYEALHYAKSQDEQAGRAILERFKANQPAFAQTIFGVFPSVIAEQDQNMAHLFMDLCFDVIAVYEHAFGKVPDQRVVGNHWFEEKAAKLDREMKVAMGQAKPNTSANTLEQEHQTGLVGFLHATIDQQPCGSTAAVRLAKTMIFTTVQLFDALYNAAVSRPHQSIH
jgi:hypothetical protein